MSRRRCKNCRHKRVRLIKPGKIFAMYAPEIEEKTACSKCIRKSYCLDSDRGVQCNYFEGVKR